jgi:hypothetical protein
MDLLVEAAFAAGFAPELAPERVWREVEFEGGVSFKFFFLPAAMGGERGWRKTRPAKRTIAGTNRKCARDSVIAKGLVNFSRRPCTATADPLFSCHNHNLLDLSLLTLTVVYILQFYCRYCVYCGLYLTIVTTGVGVLN